MAAARRRHAEDWYDSAFGLPDVAASIVPDPASSTFQVDRDSSTEFKVIEQIVAVVTATPSLLGLVREALEGRGVSVRGHDALRVADLVICDGRGDLSARLGTIRRAVRQDVAVVVVLDTSVAESVAQAHHAGAFACMRPPFVAEELASLVASALDSRAAKVQVEDLTRKLDLESHLASLGRMSAGLSHEIGNPLSIATLNMTTIRGEMNRLVEAVKWLAFAPAEELETRLAIARREIGAFDHVNGLRGAVSDTISAHRRMQALLETMRGLVGATCEVNDASIDLVEMVTDVTKWLGEELRGVEVEVIGDDVHAQADPTLIGQILQNLTANAAQAASSLPSPRVRLHAYVAGAHSIVSVRDNGPGIPVEMHDRIFEPFFTTRRGRGGTGLGLSLCREYARRAGAELSFWSVPGRGTCFRVKLPRAR